MAILLSQSEHPIFSQLLPKLKSIGVARVVLLLVLLAITLSIYFSLREQERRFAEAAFDARVSDLEKTLKLRMKNYQEMLLGVAGLYEASNSVERNEFHAYISGLHIENNYVGVLGVGYAHWLTAENLKEYIEVVRGEGFADFIVRPFGVRDNYTSITYIEPFAGRNLAAFGYDMFSEPVRRSAMVNAVVNNTTSLSAKVTLLQETNQDVQAGMLMYHPVYKKNMPLATEAQRWNALDGFAYSPFRSVDLMGAIVKDRSLDIDFKIYTSTKIDGDQEIYRTGPATGAYASRFYRQLNMTVFDQPWTLAVNSTAQFDAEHSNHFDEIVLVLGTLSSFLLFFLFCAMAAQRQSALLLAHSMSQDVHEKNRQLKHSEERFQLALKSSAMGVWSWNLVDNIVHWDASMYGLFGLPAKNSGNSYDIFLQYIHSEDRDRVLHELATAVKGHGDYETEYRLVWDDLAVHHIASRGKIIFDEHEVATAMIGTCWDITEQKRLERLKTEFIAKVSHKLRIPLTAINGALGLAVSGTLGALSEKAQSALDIAFKNSQRLTLLINDLLDMDKLLAGKVEFHCEIQAVWPLVERAVMENQADADHHQVKFVVAPINPTYKIHVQDVRFLQVMAKFLSNAAKFSPPHSEVTISVSLVAGWVRIAVADQGPGVAEEAQSQVFEKFYQADASDKRASGGTGLGLSIAKEIVERMRGRVGLISEAGGGSQFYAEFPLIAQSSSAIKY